MNDRDIDILARTLWGEARNQDREGMEAVACVVRNRVRVARENGGKFWWGSTIEEVCTKPYQFSCWNKNDPNLPKLLAVTPDKDVAFRVALDVAQNLDDLPDLTNNATHYHTKQIMPGWAEGENPTAVIGAHIFYRPREVPAPRRGPSVQSDKMKQTGKIARALSSIIGKRK